MRLGDFVRRMSNTVYYSLPELYLKWLRPQAQGTTRVAMGDLLRRAAQPQADGTLIVGTRNSFQTLLVNDTTYAQLRQEFGSLAGVAMQQCSPFNGEDVRCVNVSVPEEYSAVLHEMRKKNSKLQNKQKAMFRTNTHAEKELNDVRRVFERGGEMLSVDVEAFESNQTLLLEIGVTIFNGDQSVFRPLHFIVEDYIHCRNGTYVPDRKFDFHPGTSEILPLRDAVKRLEDIMAETRYVVGHNFKSDLKLLGSSGFRLPPNVTIFDTDVGRCKSSAACASTIAPCAFSGNL
mmetsp:Transcript_1463/g.4419  ORF Transcript_1463/g.4419 Transcript_1463/m.4419 type:complete len:290 (-) Transcript_1463:2187-3056(-)